MLSQVISLSLIFGSVPTSAIAYDGAYLICTDLAYDVMQQSIANGLPESQARDQYEKDLDRCRKEYDGRSKQSLLGIESDRRAAVKKPATEGTIAPSPSDCPPGTNAIVANDDGTVTCFTLPEKQAFQPAPGCRIIGYRPGADRKPVPIVDCQG